MTSVSRLPGPFTHEWEWQLEAACRRADARIFFHPPGERGADHEARDQAAKQVCACCPVLQPCREYALQAREPYGVWGGLTEEERQVLVGPLRRRDRNRLVG